jgi:carbon storage regulator
MLVLSRRESESLIIDENIIVTVVRIAGGGVRIGIEAPREIAIRREELAVENCPSVNSESSRRLSATGLRGTRNDLLITGQT